MSSVISNSVHDINDSLTSGITENRRSPDENRQQTWSNDIAAKQMRFDCRSVSAPRPHAAGSSREEEALRLYVVKHDPDEVSSPSQTSADNVELQSHDTVVTFEQHDSCKRFSEWMLQRTGGTADVFFIFIYLFFNFRSDNKRIRNWTNSSRKLRRTSCAPQRVCRSWETTLHVSDEFT